MEEQQPPHAPCHRCRQQSIIIIAASFSRLVFYSIVSSSCVRAHTEVSATSVAESALLDCRATASIAACGIAGSSDDEQSTSGRRSLAHHRHQSDHHHHHHHQ